ncbi:hypothetical protein [Burkholderia glumae]|uniref:hypothetical protein n=1 Tax=Burkholderia glumae TaxID=337 RepID=UPI0020370BDB|nr:hypothetical protein [Burkholderia glumae]MCM2549260.1 hypothetical protein [Burkholderia glumae]
MNNQSKSAAQQAVDELDKGKAIEFFAAAQAALFGARLELDKSLLTLSSAGIAAFVALLTTVGPGSNFVAYCACVAITCFVVVICTVLISFAKSADYLEGQLSDSPTPPSDTSLKVLDYVARGFFVVSVLASAAAGSSIAKTFLEHKADNMAQKDNIDIEQLADAIKRGEVPAMESLIIKTNPLARYSQSLKAAIAQETAAQNNPQHASASANASHASAAQASASAAPSASAGIHDSAKK